MRKFLFVLLTAIIYLINIANPAYAHASKSEYINGGIGEEDVDSMRKQAKSYPLRMVFSEEDGAYIANVTVGIYDQADKLVFYNKNSGPHLYVKLPDGEYKVVAIYKNEKRSYKITLESASSKKIFFNWRCPQAERTPEPAPEPASAPVTQEQAADATDYSIP